jgi:hypothetical protein
MPVRIAAPFPIHPVSNNMSAPAAAAILPLELMARRPEPQLCNFNEAQSLPIPVVARKPNI